MSRPRPTRSSPAGLPASSASTRANARPIALGDVAVDLLAVEPADVVGLEDLWGRRESAGARRIRCRARMLETHDDTLPGTPAGKGDAKVIVVMPARNAAQTLEATVVRRSRKAWVDEIILVDDSSTDDTVELARKLPLHVVWHPHNVGYGGNQKTCYLEALQRDADVVVMLHPDGQYEPAMIPQARRADRRAARPTSCSARASSTPAARARAACRAGSARPTAFLTGAENRLMGTELSELHTGYRAFSRELLLDGAVPAQLARLRVRLRAADAGRALRLPLPRGAVRDDLLRRGVVGLAPARASSTESRRSGPARGWSCTAAGIWRVQEVPGVKRVCVFSGSSPGGDLAYRAAASTSATGSPSAASSSSTAARASGSMGAVRRRRDGGRRRTCIGVIPQSLVDREIAHRGDRRPAGGRRRCTSARR